MNANKHGSKRTSVDQDEAPELTEEWFKQADLYEGEKLVRRGRGRPKSPTRKVLLSVRYSPEVVEYFKSTGEGWQARMDAALKEWVASHKAA